MQTACVGSRGSKLTASLTGEQTGSTGHPAVETGAREVVKMTRLWKDSVIQCEKTNQPIRGKLLGKNGEVIRNKKGNCFIMSK